MALSDVTRFAIVGFAILFLANSLQAKPDWLEKESEHFLIIYRQPHAYLVPHIEASAERALERLMEIFDYTPSEKIIIATFDLADYGTAGAISVPHNFVRLEIEPMELGYEYIGHNERIQWLMNHELTHIVFNDQASGGESFSRALFSKVAPEQGNPLSVCYSLLTNHNRYSPRWHQEGIAVFTETWMSGGYGRVLGNFDEMFFRARVLEDGNFPTHAELEAKSIHESFLIGSLHYLYGTRFLSYLAATYSAERLISWYRNSAGDFGLGFESRFEKTFGISLNSAWKDFIAAEKRFQSQNLAGLNAAPLTPIRKLHDKPFGWVTQPFLTTDKKILFGHLQSHQITSLKMLDIDTGAREGIGSLPSPSVLQISSVAFDSSVNYLFYTTNNSQLFRDIHIKDIATGKSKILFEDVRAGQLTVSPQTKELWGTRHHLGKVSLVYSPFPYKTLIPVIEFEYGDVLQHLSISPSGKYLAATLHHPSGSQEVIAVDIEQFKKSGRFLYQTVSADGSPEFPSWSPDEQYLYWNAFTNGVSNIYRNRVGTAAVEPLSHTLRGLFRPIHISKDSLMAFEFSSEGFMPVMIPNRKAERLPAIQYYGQKVFDKNPYLANWLVETKIELAQSEDEIELTGYSGLKHLKVQSIMPVISGFQNQVVAGVYANLADPFNFHKLNLEMGFSNFSNTPGLPNFHFKGRYDYKHKYFIELHHNASSFYDLFNERKSGFIGTFLKLGHSRFLKYDMPHKIEHRTELSIFRDVKAIHDNTVPVDNPDFTVLESSISSKNTRRALGSVDNEFGSEWKITANLLGMNPENPQFAGGLNGEWGQFLTWMRPHNILHIKAAAGYVHGGEDLFLAKYYFGGFGNQHLENKPVKQYRDTFRFPGIPYNSLYGDYFAKLMLEHNLPPLRLSSLKMGQHFLSHIDASWFSQALITNGAGANQRINLGGQVNFVFSHWFNLESTISVGAAQAWNNLGGTSREVFVSLKLLRN